jgi:hypothetical protein
VTVLLDQTPPTLTCPSNIVVWTCETNGLPVTFGVTATDDCDTNVMIVCNPNSGALFPLGTNDVTCTARDDCGHVSTCAFKVIVIQDVLPPRIDCPTNIVVTCNRTNGAVVDYVVTASDDCDTNVLVTCDPPTGSLFPFGTNTVRCEAVDDCGHTNRCSFTIRVLRPFLTISLSRTNVVISWTGNGTLEQTDALLGNGPPTIWMDTPGNPTSPYTVAATEAKRFYRVRGCR